MPTLPNLEKYLPINLPASDQDPLYTVEWSKKVDHSTASVQEFALEVELLQNFGQLNKLEESLYKTCPPSSVKTKSKQALVNPEILLQKNVYQGVFDEDLSYKLVVDIFYDENRDEGRETIRLTCKKRKHPRTSKRTAHHNNMGSLIKIIRGYVIEYMQHHQSEMEDAVVEVVKRNPEAFGLPKDSFLPD